VEAADFSGILVPVYQNYEKKLGDLDILKGGLK
jgi:hypothetical protein